ncbi:tyrosine-type recombinase/integrase [Paraburkholderia fungorum]|uniref:tyrosine-type recombinase/integrase n=1 Tax=Paraburkholderia fungorum TaxID=134537 RepID=UPI0038BD3C09
MAKAPVIEDKQLRHMLKVAAVTGESPVRDVALLYVLYGTGVMLTELASITIRDYLRENGSIREESAIRNAIAHNSKERQVFWVNAKLVAAVDAYLAARVTLRHGVTVRKAAFRGLDPDGPIFRRADGEPYGLTARKARSGTISYSCDSLSQVIRRLHTQAGVEGGHALAGRRTFAVRLHRRGYDLRHISELLGHGTLTATKQLIDSDPVKLGDLVAGVI